MSYVFKILQQAFVDLNRPSLVRSTPLRVLFLLLYQLNNAHILLLGLPRVTIKIGVLLVFNNFLVLLEGVGVRAGRQHLVEAVGHLSLVQTILVVFTC